MSEMTRKSFSIVVLHVSACLLLLCCVISVSAQQAASAAANAAVPPVVKFSGVLNDVNSKALTGTVGVTFSFYSESEGGAALWVETQNVTPDRTGHYSVILGSTTSQGLPAGVFANGEARWLGVQVQGQTEQPRTLLMSVPYALKALDAETIGGKPASSFMLSPQAGGKSAAPGKLPPGTITGSGTADFIPAFTGATTIGNSKIFQTVGGSVGIGTTTPAGKLDVAGTGDVRDTLTLFPKSTHSTLSIHGTAFEVNGKGLITFVSGQAFPGTGTVTSVGSGAGLAGGPITGSGTLSIASGGVANSMLANPSLTVAAGTGLTGGGRVALGGTTTLNLDTTKVPLLNAANTFTGNQTVNGNLSATGVVTGSSYQIGSNLFAFGSYNKFNAFLGFAGNTATTGTGNTANGVAALQGNTTGSNNTASGAYALDGNSGSNNTVIGFQAIYGQGTGSFNTALGALSGLTNDSSDMTGTNNTFLGIGTAISTGTVSNATAIGANADVAESNALVLGSINGVNGATASANVGIGTTTPLAALDVAGGGAVHTFIGNPNCGGFAGVGFGASGFNSCQNYSVVGDGTNTFIAAPTGQILFRVDKNAYTAMFIGSSGAVGIGTVSPDNSLSVNGNADKTGGGSWGTFSDGRLKNLNGSFNTGLSQVLKIHPVRYRYKADNAMGIRDTDEHIGVVAQEVQKVIPEAVTQNSKGYLLVNNDPIIWTMLNAIKEQQGLIHKQQVLVQIQQAKIDRLSRQVRAVQAALKASQRADANVQTASAMAPPIHH
jgi:trimeric autotransporter adhesin